MELDNHLGLFDVILLANLIDRIPNPSKCLHHLQHRIHAGGQLIITSPYTWLSSFTPQEHWLGGHKTPHKTYRSWETLQTLLDDGFTLHTRKDMPFIIREHARKFQWSVAEASVWIKK